MTTNHSTKADTTTVDNDELKQILSALGEGGIAVITDEGLAEEIDSADETSDPEAQSPKLPSPKLIVREPDSWQEKLWMVPAETRLYTADVAEAVDRSSNWVHQRTSDSEDHDRIPHRKRNGQLVFKAGEVREWLRGQEEVIVAGSSTPSAAERGGFKVVGDNVED